MTEWSIWFIEDQNGWILCKTGMNHVFVNQRRYSEYELSPLETRFHDQNFVWNWPIGWQPISPCKLIHVSDETKILQIASFIEGWLKKTDKQTNKLKVLPIQVFLCDDASWNTFFFIRPKKIEKTKNLGLRDLFLSEKHGSMVLYQNTKDKWQTSFYYSGLLRSQFEASWLNICLEWTFRLAPKAFTVGRAHCRNYNVLLTFWFYAFIVRLFCWLRLFIIVGKIQLVRFEAAFLF